MRHSFCCYKFWCFIVNICSKSNSGAKKSQFHRSMTIVWLWINLSNHWNLHFIRWERRGRQFAFVKLFVYLFIFHYTTKHIRLVLRTTIWCIYLKSKNYFNQFLEELISIGNGIKLKFILADELFSFPVVFIFLSKLYKWILNYKLLI